MSTFFTMEIYRFLMYNYSIEQKLWKLLRAREEMGKIMRRKLIIIGASGHGKVAADIALKMNKWNSISFLDDNKSLKTSLGIEVIGTTNDAMKYKDEADFFVAIGKSITRASFQSKLEERGFSIASLIHPDAIIGPQVEIGQGTVIMAGVVINCCTKIGKGCIVNTSATIDHDCMVEDYVHIGPGVNLAGEVNIGPINWIGIGSVISNNITICKGNMIGAGAVVVKDITEPGTYIGLPARRVNK